MPTMHMIMPPSPDNLVTWRLSGSAVDPQSLAVRCRCKNPTHKPRRHWQTACPFNPNLKPSCTCPTCGRKFNRKDNLKRHLRDFHHGEPIELTSKLVPLVGQ